MTVTAIDPVSALVVVDFQKGVRSSPAGHLVDDAVARAAELATAFRGAGQPVILVSYLGGASGRSDATRARAESLAAAGPDAPAPQGPPADWADLLPELDAQPGDHAVSKTGWGSFAGTGLDELLRSLGATQVVIAGVMTSLGVESTAREARDRGYNVVLATDAMADMNPAAHAHSIAAIFPLLGESATASQIVGMLAM